MQITVPFFYIHKISTRDCDGVILNINLRVNVVFSVKWFENIFFDCDWA